MKLHYIEDLGERSPATVNRTTGDIFVDKAFMEYPSSIQKFILLHERGHHDLQTTVETEADEFAFNHYVGSEPESLKKSILAISQVLTESPAKQQRLYNQIIRVLQYDADKYNNPKAKQLLTSLINNNMQNYNEQDFSQWNWRKSLHKFAALNQKFNPALIAGRAAMKYNPATLAANTMKKHSNFNDVLYTGYNENPLLAHFDQFVGETYFDQFNNFDELRFNTDYSNFTLLHKFGQFVKKTADKLPLDQITPLLKDVPYVGAALQARQQARALIAKLPSAHPADVPAIQQQIAQQQQVIAQSITANPNVATVINAAATGAIAPPATDTILGMPKYLAMSLGVGVGIVLLIALISFINRK